jgi:hypothetical protein
MRSAGRKASGFDCGGQESKISMMATLMDGTMVILDDVHLEG